MDDTLAGKDYLTAQDWSKEELERALDLASELKDKFMNGEPHRKLRDKTLFMIFFNPSTRTRNSFEAGMTQLGGHAHDLSVDKLWLSHGETARDTAKVFNQYGHGLAIRNCEFSVGDDYVRSVAENSSVPVFNMQTDKYHPCQALADLLTLKENLGKLKNKKFVISWAHSPRYDKPISVPQSLITLMPRFGLDVTLARPPEFRLNEDMVRKAEKNAKDANSNFEVTENMEEAFEEADAVYPKSWGCFYHAEKKNIKSFADKYKDWICDGELMEKAKDDALYMHCLPADRGTEVTDGVIDSEQSVVYQEAGNRLHVQKALMALTMSSKKKLL